MKKRAFQKITSLVLTGSLALSLAGCGGSSSSGTQESGGESAAAAENTVSTETAEKAANQISNAERGEQIAKAEDEGIEKKDGFAKYDDTVTMTAMTTIASTATAENYASSKWSAKLKELFNIDISYSYVTSDKTQYDNRVSLMLAGGDLPNVMNVSLTQLQQMAEAGLLEPLTQSWEEYASDQAIAAMTADGTNPFGAATIDGELYGIPWVNPEVETCHALFVNEKWRKDLGLPEPDTWENFEKLIYGFKENDPNGNGEADEYGLGLDKELFGYGYEFTSVANAFGAYPNAWIVGEDGTVKYGSVQPEMKQVLEKMQQYYADGLIDPEFIVKSQDDEAELVTQGKLGVMFGIQWTGLMGSAIQSLYENSEDPDSLEWKVYPIPSVDGKETSPIVYDNSSQWLVVTKGYEHPEAVVKICNYMHYMGRGPQAEGPEGHSELAISYEEWNDMWNNDSYRVYSPESEHGNIDRWTHWFQAMEDGDTEWIDSNYLASDQYYAMLRFKEDGSQMTNNFGEKDITAASWQFVYQLCGQTFMYALDEQNKDNLTHDVQGAFVSDTMVEDQQALDDLELQTFTSIITGEADVDSFDSFVESWKSMGGDQITEEMNSYYQQMHSAS